MDQTNTDMKSTCIPGRFYTKKVAYGICGVILSYFLFILATQRLSPLQQPHTLPMTMKEYYHRISVDEDNWIVTYLPQNWSGTITHLMDITNWGTVIIGETMKGPVNCRTPRCFYLGPFETHLLNLSTTRHLRGNQKKLIGQIVAIILGAEHILAIDIDRVPAKHIVDLVFPSKTSGLAHSGGAIFNPYSLQRHLVSSDHIFTKEAEIKSLLFTATRQDQLWRHQQSQEIKPEGTSSQPFYLSQNSFTNLNNLDVIYSHDAFWAMVYPATRSVLNYGELDSFWVQKLIHAMDKTVQVSTPITHPHINSTISPRYNATDEFVADVIFSLNKFRCGKSNVQITKCTESLFHELIRKKLYPPASFQILKDYFADLQSINYHFPVIEKSLKPESFPFSLFMSQMSFITSPRRPIFKYSNIYTVCPGKKFRWHAPIITDILLIITIQNPLDYQTIPLLDFIYRRWFRHVMYCGPNIRDFTNKLGSFRLPISLFNIYFVDGMDTKGLFTQKCMMAAMVIDFKVKGYLQIKSDTLLNPWTIREIPRDKILMAGDMGTIDATKAKKKYWDWWAKECGRSAWTKFFSYLQQTKATESLSVKLLKTFAANTKPNTAYYSGWNIFYIPSQLKEGFIHAANKTIASGLMNEIALPTIVLGLQNKSKLYKIKDHSLWGDDSLKYDQLYKTTDKFLFPFNLRTELKTPKGKKFVCENYLINSEKQLKIKQKG